MGPSCLFLLLGRGSHMASLFLMVILTEMLQKVIFLWILLLSGKMLAEIKLLSFVVVLNCLLISIMTLLLVFCLGVGVDHLRQGLVFSLHI